MNNKKHGTGRYLFKDDGEYVGQFAYGLRNGSGRYVCRGFNYNGEWINDKMHGNGVLNGQRVLMRDNYIDKYL
jgi:hypothetical protein